MEDKCSFDDMIKAEQLRRAKENPWTEADEARYSAKSKAEKEAQEKWAAAHPEPQEEDEDEEESEDETR